MSAVLFGSISTLADTSELQREAFNEAFEEHGLGWSWDRDTYVSMLGESGGAGRIAAYAADRGEDVDAAAVHATKSRLFQEHIPGASLSPRPGVAETIRDARAAGVQVGLVTTTSAENVEALLQALDIKASELAVVVDLGVVGTPKPDPAAYAHALKALGLEASSCVAIEDNVDGMRAALAAGIPCIAFPNANTTGQDFAGAAMTTDAVALGELQGFFD